MGHTYPDVNKTHDDRSIFTLQMTGLFILEFGVIFHFVLTGLALAVSGEEFVVLHIVFTFHQTFEGLGLGPRCSRGRDPSPLPLQRGYSRRA